MFRQPSQAEYDYLLPYLQNAENLAVQNLDKTMIPLKVVRIITIIAGFVFIFFMFPVSIFLWFTAWRMFQVEKETKRQALNKINQPGYYLFEIADCTLLDLFYRKNDPNYHPSMVVQEPMANIIMLNGVRMPAYFIQTTESNAMGITNFDSKYEYNAPAYYIKLVNNTKNYVLVKP